MAHIPSVRQTKIIEWLEESKTLTIDELAEKFGVSIMTIHRDLDALAKSGLIEKVHGGVNLITPETSPPQSTPTCSMCGMTVSERIVFSIQLKDGTGLNACCPHCGFLLLDQYEASITAVLVKDFLHGRIMNGLEATYLVGCSITLCCMPTILSFTTLDEAERFQRGFEGEIMRYAQVRDYLVSRHSDM